MKQLLLLVATVAVLVGKDTKTFVSFTRVKRLKIRHLEKSSIKEKSFITHTVLQGVNSERY